MSYDFYLYCFKALSAEDVYGRGIVPVHGFFFDGDHGPKILSTSLGIDIKIDTSSLCRNTGILSHGEYLFENDLVEWSYAGDKGIGVIRFDELRKCYTLKRNANCSGSRTLESVCIENIIGNIALSSIDAQKFQRYSDDEDAKYSGPQATDRSSSGDRYQARCHKEAMRGIGFK